MCWKTAPHQRTYVGRRSINLSVLQTLTEPSTCSQNPPLNLNTCRHTLSLDKDFGFLEKKLSRINSKHPLEKHINNQAITAFAFTTITVFNVTKLLKCNKLQMNFPLNISTRGQCCQTFPFISHYIVLRA